MKGAATLREVHAVLTCPLRALPESRATRGLPLQQTVPSQPEEPKEEGKQLEQRERGEVESRKGGS